MAERIGGKLIAGTAQGAVGSPWGNPSPFQVPTGNDRQGVRLKKKKSQ